MNASVYSYGGIDSNGESEVIALWLVTSENKSIISHVIETFMCYNDTSNTKCVMIDKDMTERENLPNA